MHKYPKNSNSRVGIYLEPHTRNRLNKFKADRAFATGETLSQDAAINILIDHYGKTTAARQTQDADRVPA